MACPGNTSPPSQITMKGIHQELQTNNYSNAVFDNNQIKMSELHDGTEGTINTGNHSDNRPNGSAPHSASEFFSYDHDYVKSDIRLKTNIELMGSSSGLNIPIYTFVYKDNPNQKYKGTMAQDLIKMGFDDSVVMGDDGFYSVKYDNIDVDFNVL